MNLPNLNATLNIGPLHLDLMWTLLIHLGTVLMILLAILLIAQILRSRRVPAATLGWLIVIIFVPYIGIPLYMLIGERKLQAKIRRISRIDMPNPAVQYDHELHYLLVSLGIPSSSTGNQVVFHRDAGSARTDLWNRLEQARKSIDIEVFIFRPDDLGKQLLELLERKLHDGVEVRLLIDDVGSFELTRRRLRGFTGKGGQVARFMPVFASPLRSRHNLRDHRKIVIVDREWVWSGGRNIADEYLKPEEETLWVDLSFSQMGGAVSVYQSVFESDWHFACETDALVHVPVPPSSTSDKGRVQVLPSGPDVADDPIHSALLTACYGAKKRIRIVTPYYIPDDGVQQALRLAALRGVRVELLLPQHCDHRIADIARNRYLRDLHDAGVRIWFLPEKMVHAKLVIFDDDVALCGTANLDIRSLFLNFEVMSAFYSPQEVGWLIGWFERWRMECLPHHPKPASLTKEIIEGLVLLLAYQL